MRDGPFQLILSEAKRRGVTVQELLRAVILPEWVRENLLSSTLPEPVRQFVPGLIIGTRR